MDIEAAVRYPTTDEDEWVKTVLIGGGIFLLSWLLLVGGMFVSYALGIFTVGIGTLLTFPLVVILGIVVSAPIGGYVVEVIRQTIRGNDRPPRFQNFGKLVKDGLSVTAIGFAYQLPLFLVGGIAFVVFGVLFGLGAVLEAEALTGIGVLLGVVGQFLFMAVFGLYSIAVAYILPASVCSFAQEGSIGAAFDVDRLKTVATSSEYAVAWLVAFGINFVAGQFLQILYVLIVGFFVQFYLVVVMARLLAGGYADAIGIQRPEDQEPAQPSTGWDA